MISLHSSHVPLNLIVSISRFRLWRTNQYLLRSSCTLAYSHRRWWISPLNSPLGSHQWESKMPKNTNWQSFKRSNVKNYMFWKKESVPKHLFHYFNNFERWDPSKKKREVVPQTKRSTREPIRSRLSLPRNEVDETLRSEDKAEEQEEVESDKSQKEVPLEKVRGRVQVWVQVHHLQS